MPRFDFRCLEGDLTALYHDSGPLEWLYSLKILFWDECWGPRAWVRDSYMSLVGPGAPTRHVACRLTPIPPAALPLISAGRGACRRTPTRPDGSRSATSSLRHPVPSTMAWGLHRGQPPTRFSNELAPTANNVLPPSRRGGRWPNAGRRPGIRGASVSGSVWNAFGPLTSGRR